MKPERTIDFSRLVHELRVATGITQEQLARELGVSYGTVNSWENGKHRPLRILARRLLQRASRAGLPLPYVEPVSPERS